ncbi:MAG: hypothetical protein KJI69_05005 [Patescibacteria group bacterium]|nr:hypothetical protein [Patescibacteria group bacterium]
MKIITSQDISNGLLTDGFTEETFTYTSASDWCTQLNKIFSDSKVFANLNIKSKTLVNISVNIIIEGKPYDLKVAEIYVGDATDLTGINYVCDDIEKALTLGQKLEMKIKKYE